MDNYGAGRRAEEKVARSLRGTGASVELSPGSRGAADLVAVFPSGRKWLIQVKAGENPPSQLAGVSKQRLTQSATKQNATPVLATVADGEIEYRSARSNRRLRP